MMEVYVKSLSEMFNSMSVVWFVYLVIVLVTYIGPIYSEGKMWLV